MSETASRLARASAWVASRPRLALVAVVVIVAVSGYGLGRIQMASSLSAMIGSKSRASVALERIARDYHSSDELLLLCTLPSEAADDGEDLLERFGESLIVAAGSDAEASGMIASIRFRQDPEYARFAREFVLPSLPYYMSDSGFEEFRDRLTPDGMNRQMNRAEAMLSAPGAGTASIVKQVLRDPLRLAELVERSGFSTDTGVVEIESGVTPPLLLSRDGRTLLIRIAGVRQVDDLTFSAALTDRVWEIAQGLNHEGLRLELAGGYAIATTTSRGIRADMIRSIVVAVVLVHVLFFVLYRHLLAPFVVGGIAGIGILAGFGAQGLGNSVITPLSASITAMLAGLGVDYGIHLLAHYQGERPKCSSSVEATRNSVGRVGGAILASGLTTTIGFGSMIFSEVTMLRSFAVIGVACLLGCLVAVLFLMPASFVLMDRFGPRVPRPPRLSWVGGVISARARWCLGAGLAVVALEIGTLSVLGWAPALETDLSMLHPRPNKALEATNTLPSRFEGLGEWLPVQVEGETWESVIGSAHEIDRALTGPGGIAIGVTRAFGLQTVLPDPRRSALRRQSLGEFDPEDVRAAFAGAVGQSVFQDDAFEEYGDTVADLVRAPRPTIDRLREFPTIASRMIPGSDAVDESPRSLLVVQFSGPLTDRADRDRAIEGVRELLEPIRGATLSGVTAVAYDMEQATRGDLVRLITMAGGLIVLCLLVVLRRPVLVLLALIPLGSGALLMLTGMAVSGLGINALNGAAVPLLLGITVDAGVFLVAFRAGHLARHTPGGSEDHKIDYGASVQAVIAASATTLIGFGAVCLSSTPAIRSLGMLTCIGVVGSTLGALLILVPILVLRSNRHGILES